MKQTGKQGSLLVNICSTSVWIVASLVSSLMLHRIVMFFLDFKIKSTYPGLKFDFVAGLYDGIVKPWEIILYWPRGTWPMLITCLYGLVAGLVLHKSPIKFVPICLLVIALIVNFVYVNIVTGGRIDFFLEHFFCRAIILALMTGTGILVDRWVNRTVMPFFALRFQTPTLRAGSTAR